MAVSPASGEKLAAYRLDFTARFDGLIAARGRIFVALDNGALVCFGSRPENR